MAIKIFKEIVAWQKAHKLALMVYNLTVAYLKRELSGLVGQSRRCVVSVASNIAKGSLEELKYQLS